MDWICAVSYAHKRAADLSPSLASPRGTDDLAELRRQFLRAYVLDLPPF